MLAQADHNNMGSLSKQHEGNKMTDSTVHFQRSEKCKFKKISAVACPRTPLEFFGTSGTRNTGHLRLWCNLQQASHALETSRLESSGLIEHCKHIGSRSLSPFLCGFLRFGFGFV